MARALSLVNGIPRMIDVADPLTVKDEGSNVDTDVNVIDFTGGSITATSTGSGSIEVSATSSGDTVEIYDESTQLGSDLTSGNPLTLPSSKTYDGAELEVYLNGQRLQVSEDFDYVGSAPRTQVTFTEDLLEGDVVRFRIDRDVNDSPAIYDQVLEVVTSGAGAGEINVSDAETGDNITLPASQTYEDDELEVYMNGQRIEGIRDYNYVGSIPRTQIALTFDAEVGDIIRFRIDRNA